MARYIVTLATLVTLLQTSTTLNAQATVASQSRAHTDRKVILSLSSVTLQEALTKLSHASGVQIGLSTEVIRFKDRKDVKISEASVSEALRTILHGTQFQARPAESGGWIVVSAERSNTRNAQGIISGKVTDAKTGLGVSGATVSLGNNARGAATAENGSYKLSGIVAGTHVVSVRLVGYAKQSRSVVVAEGATVTVDFKIEPSANVLDQVVVTGTIVSTELKAIPTAITVITAKQIEERGITRIDQLFRGEIPGLFSMEQGTSAELNEVAMFSRGATNIDGNTNSNSGLTNPIKTYVDGVEMADPRYLSQIDPKSIERIEILTGPQASTIYGANAINGVMQIFTKRGTTVRPSIILSLSEGLSENNLNAALTPSHQYDGNVSGLEGKFSYNVGSGWDYTGAWIPGRQLQRTSVYGGGRYQTGTLSLDLSARQGWTANKREGTNEGVNLALIVQDGLRQYSQSSVRVPPSKMSLSGRTLGVNLSYNPFSWWSHQLNVGGDESDTRTIESAPAFIGGFDTTYRSSQAYNTRSSQSYSSTLRFPILSLAQATLTYGGDHWRVRSSSVLLVRNPDGSMSGSEVIPPSPSNKNTGAYAQGQLSFLDALFFTYGVRADWNPNFGERAKVRPGRYGVSYAREFGSVSAKFRGSYGRSIRPPAPGEIQGIVNNDTAAARFYGLGVYHTLPNPDLGAEFQQGGEGGLELYFSNRVSIVLTRYNQTVEGLIQPIFPVDSVRALQPGYDTKFQSYCDPGLIGLPLYSLRSDGYCYFLQPQNVNVGAIRNQGWEMQGSVNIGPITTHGTYSWVKSRVIGVTPKYRGLVTHTVFTPGQTFNFIPEHTWAMNVAYALRGTSVSLNVNGVGIILREIGVSSLGPYMGSLLRMRAQQAYIYNVPTYRQPTTGYAITNINASHRFSDKIDVTLQIANLTNHYQNDYRNAFPVLGRSSRIGVRWRWQ